MPPRSSPSCRRPALQCPAPASVLGKDDGDRAGRDRDGIAFLGADRTLAIVLVVTFVSLLFMTATGTARCSSSGRISASATSPTASSSPPGPRAWCIGAVVISRRVEPGRLAFVALLMIGLQGVGIGLPTIFLAVGFAAAMWVVGGIAHGTKNVLVRTLIQERVPDAGTVAPSPLTTGCETVPSCSALAGGGVLVSAIGARETLLLAGGLPLLAALAGLALYARRGDSAPASAVEFAESLPADASPVPAPGAAE